MEKKTKDLSNIGIYDECRLCPRQCGINRSAKRTGTCGVTDTLRVARAALHFWEEPCISGTKGSGAVFFSGCNMHCVFCQNENIAQGLVGKDISIERLAEIFLELQDKGANNLNLVTAGHYVPSVIKALDIAKHNGFCIPVIYNSSGYEKVDTLKALEGYVDVYLPDFKYMDEEISINYSKAKDYALVAKEALKEMVRQQPSCVFYPELFSYEESVKNGLLLDEEEEGFLIGKGVIVRQLLLPGHLEDAKAVTKYLYETYRNQIYISLMSQYTPLKHHDRFMNLNRKVEKEEYEEWLDYVIKLGLEQGFVQDLEVAMESFIPHFDGEGV